MASDQTATLEWQRRSSSESPWFFYVKRQSGGSNGPTAVPSSSPSPSPTNNNQGVNNGQAPLTVYTFIIAIALFVLVVSFVLLRIFVRNRRLRALGLYPESPIERLLGGAPREYEDNLPPPKLWDAKIADVRANNTGAITRAEKSMLGGGVGAGDVQEHGWDALMPVSAALPPNLYPVIFQQDIANTTSPSTAANPANADTATASASATYQASNSAARLARHMPNFLRPRSASGADATTAGAPGSSAVNADATVTSSKVEGQTESAAAGAGTTTEEKIASSVNVTVLIAMPSPRTVFPSARRPLHSNALHRSTSKLNGSGIAVGSSKLEEVNEAADTNSISSDKGKARRAPSIHSVRTTASTKSQGEARREAFFGASIDVAPATLPPVDPRPYDDEEDELPELVFGTASVPLYSKIVVDEALSKPAFASAPRLPTSLVPPTRDELLALVAAANEARSQKPPKIRQKDKSKLEDDGEAATAASGAAARQSVAGTSMEGVGGADDRSVSGDALLRNGRSGVEEYEMGDISRPSIGGAGTSASFVGEESRANDGSRLSMTHAGLLSAGAPMGVNEDAASMADSTQAPMGATAASTSTTAPGVEHSNSSAHSGALSAHTARETASSPTNTQTDRQSFNTWHTGDDDDNVAHLAAHAINFDHDPPTTATPLPTESQTHG